MLKGSPRWWEPRPAASDAPQCVRARQPDLSKGTLTEGTLSFGGCAAACAEPSAAAAAGTSVCDPSTFPECTDSSRASVAAAGVFSVGAVVPPVSGGGATPPLFRRTSNAISSARSPSSSR
eukprot:TRINITY_DN819_c1_g1_i4.p3 TRINITY_DN819_c1_g1~~TRINITY_DN819_c1_g1_i4.p3  ORF type:complete len:121 (+),score=11.14 TRINITY_DN819_c1_g1_i4:120-482(+)